MTPEVPVNVPQAVHGGDPFAVGAVIGVIAALLLADLLLFARDREPSVREGAVWSVGWLVLGLLVTVPIAVLSSPNEGVNYLTVYLIERALSLDNLVVFLLIFAYFAVPQEHRAILVFWGIGLALAMRGVAIVVGVELIERFDLVLYAFGVALVVLAWRMWHGTVEHLDPDENPLVKLVRRIWPVGGYHGSRFSVSRDGRRVLTPLALALVSVVAADLAFAADSIPAAFAITDDALVIWAANGFALLGLRALFVLVAELIRSLRYLNQTVAIVLAVVAVKLLIHDLYEVPAPISLAVVLALFGAGAWLSLAADRREARNGPPPPPAPPPVPQPSSAS